MQELNNSTKSWYNFWGRNAKVFPFILSAKYCYCPPTTICLFDSPDFLNNNHLKKKSTCISEKHDFKFISKQMQKKISFL